MDGTNPSPHPRTTTPATLPLKEQEECLPDPNSLSDPPTKYTSPLSSSSHGLFAFGIANLKMVDQNRIDFIKNHTANHDAVVHGWCRAHCYSIAFKALMNDAASCENYKEAQVFSDAAQRWQSISNHEKSLMESSRWEIKYPQQKIALHSKRHEWSKCAEFKSLSKRSQEYLDGLELEDTREEVIKFPNALNDEHEPSCAATSTENADDEADNQQNDDDDVEDEQTNSTSDCLLSSLQVREKHMPLNLTL
jgi:hypothetical protein